MMLRLRSYRDNRRERRDAVLDLDIMKMIEATEVPEVYRWDLDTMLSMRLSPASWDWWWGKYGKG